MKQDINTWSLFSRYQPAYQLPLEGADAAMFQAEPETLWFLFDGDRILFLPNKTPVITDAARTASRTAFPIGMVSVPCGGDAADWVCEWRASIAAIHMLGQFCGHPCCAVEVTFSMKPEQHDGDSLVWKPLRELLPELDDDAGFLAGRALQILNWQRNNRFCGRCGSPMMPRTDERAMRCPDCGYLQYPRLSPAIIVAVQKAEKLLLGHNNHFPAGRFSLLAGFVEPGETFEDCVRREIQEEVGIHVTNIRYLSSQPWPFPDSLMVGFSADWEAGELQPDGVEIAQAEWFSREQLPDIPGPHTIAGKIIRQWQQGYESPGEKNML